MPAELIPVGWIEMAALIVIALSVFVMAFLRRRK